MENSPKVSVIIPSLDGCRDGNVERLLSDLKEQTYKDIEIKVIKGIRPNGKARNIGVKEAKGRIIVFIDDDIRLGHDKVLWNIIRPLEEDDRLAMTGASVKIYEDAGYLQREYDRVRNFSSPVKDTMDYQGRVGHACLAIKKSIFEDVGGESENLITGTDVDLNTRIKVKGYKVSVVPHTWVYHLMPDTVRKLAKEAFICGLGSAYAIKMLPEIFGLPKIKFINYTVKTRNGALIYKIISTLIRLPIYILTFEPVHFLFYLFHTAGHVYGWMKFRGALYIKNYYRDFKRVEKNVSIIICTYKRPEAAKKLLSELEKQRYKDFEALVVSQGDKSDLERIRDSVKNTYTVRYYYEEIPNLPHARNVGIKEASGKIVMFLDDDAKPHETLLEAHVANYADPTIGIVGGRVLEEEYERNVPDSKIGTIRKLDGFAYGGFYKDIRREVMHVRGVNMSARRETAMEVGGFDERFEGTAEREDMDFCLRVLRMGHKIVFDPTAVIEHLALPSGGCRVETKEESIYWLYRNHTLTFLNNFNKLFYPILIAEYIARIIRRSLLWHNPSIIGSGFRGIRDGWKAHFSVPHKRLEKKTKEIT